MKRSTIEVIGSEIETDDITRDAQENNLKKAYEEGNVDDFLIALCGWSWKTIQEKRNEKRESWL